MSFKELNPEQRKFVSRYLKGFNATRAYLETYGEQEYQSAASSASKLLKNHKVMKVIDNVLDRAFRRIRVSKERVISELASIAFVDVRQFYDSKGVLKGLDELNKSQQAAIQSIETEQIAETLITKKKLKFHSKPKALETLAKHLDLVKEPGTNVNVNVYPDHTVVFQDIKPDDNEETTEGPIHASEGPKGNRLQVPV